MSLDQNLFTLLFTPNKHHPNVTDLVDPSGTMYYHKRRAPGPEYKIEVFDHVSESLLITASAPSASSKTKSLELYNPTSVVELKYTGTMSFRWGFKWEEHEFEWKREQCFLIRKPDPPVLVAVTKEASRQVKTAQVQLLDYNLHRFDIEDRKGLEIVILTALMTFHDAKEASVLGETIVSSPVSEQPPSTPGSLSRQVSAIMMADIAGPPPPTPPKPAPKTGLDRIAEMQALKGEDYNEITVEDEGSVEEYAQYCNNLLSDDAMLFISVKSSAAEFVPKVLQIVEETKRIRYKAGLDDEELHQYVLYDIEKKKERKRINLNDDADQKNKYAPPSDLTVHLSKIDMPELQPKSHSPPKPSSSSSKPPPSSSSKANASSTSKPPGGKTGKKKDDKKASPPPTPGPSSSTLNNNHGNTVQPQPKPPRNKLTRPPRDDSPKRKPSPSANPPQHPQHQQHRRPTPSPPPAGVFNSYHPNPHPYPQPQTSGALSVSFPNAPPPPPPGFPQPSVDNSGQHGSGRIQKLENAAMSLYNSLMPHTPAAGGTPPPGPPPGQYAGQQQQQHQASGSGMSQKATAVAQNVVSGIFDIVKNANTHRK